MNDKTVVSEGREALTFDDTWSRALRIARESVVDAEMLRRETDAELADFIRQHRPTSEHLRKMVTI